MNVVPFLSELQRLDIRLWLDGDRLRCNAPAGALTGPLREELARRRADIIGFLRLAGALGRQNGDLVPLQPHGDATPVFAVPGHTGDVFAYRALAQALGSGRPFFALQPPGLDGRSEPLERIEDLAARFAEQVKSAVPGGPWIVAGYCMGGTVAFELARQLSECGTVAFLALFAAPFPAFFRPLSLLRHTLAYRAQGWQRRLRLLAGQSGRERLEYLLWRARLPWQEPDRLAVLRARLEGATLRAVRVYQPRRFAGRAHHFLPCEGWAERSRSGAGRWRPLVDALEVHCGPRECTADDMLLAPNAPLVAAQFGAAARREAG